MGASICLRLKASSWRVSAGARSAAWRSPGRAAQVRVGADAFEQEFGVSRDDREQVVEVMRDAAGEASDGFHLLRLAELLLQGAAFGDVLGEQFEEDGVAIVAEGASGERTLMELLSLRTQSAARPWNFCRDGGSRPG